MRIMLYRFAINYDLLREELPPDALESMFILAQQCTETDQYTRPTAEETYEWMNDLYGQTSKDSTPAIPFQSFLFSNSNQLTVSAVLQFTRENSSPLSNPIPFSHNALHSSALLATSLEMNNRNSPQNSITETEFSDSMSSSLSKEIKWKVKTKPSTIYLLGFISLMWRHVLYFSAGFATIRLFL